MNSDERVMEDMTAFGFHASHEQVHPNELLAAVQRAEQAGFDAAMSSDHFSPWSSRQGESAFAWSWLGAALQATTLPFGVVNAPGQRYHPAIIAQAIGTLADMSPAGSGPRWAPAKPATSTSPVTDGRVRRSAHSDCESAWTSSERCCAARSSGSVFGRAMLESQLRVLRAMTRRSGQSDGPAPNTSRSTDNPR